MSDDYRKDQDRLLDALEETAWKAEKREAIDAKRAEAEALGVKPSLIHESFTGAQRQYARSKRVDHQGLLDRDIRCVQDMIIWRLQVDINRKRGAR